MMVPTWVPPSLTALRAFETAARSLSFTGAAEELNQTQGAISHQVNMLEARLGLKLFVREARGLKLTDAGQKYLPLVRDALNRTPGSSVGRSQASRIFLLDRMSQVGRRRAEDQSISLMADRAGSRRQ